MRLFTLSALTLLALAAGTSLANAQSNRALEQLSAINRINPLQNPEYDRGEKMVDRKIIDRKNKVIGRVQDIIVNKNGTIASLKTDLDRLRLGDEINLNYRNMAIRTVSNAYALNLDSDEITDLFPELLANMDTASGDDDETFSVRAMQDVTLRTHKGKKIGKIDDVLFASNGGIVRALQIKLTAGIQRGETIAIPFREAEFKSQNGRLSAEVSEDFADAMLKLADD